MKDTTTPRTDALRTKLHENINTPNIVKYMETILHANTLETELTAAREEITQLKVQLTKDQGCVTISRNCYVQELEQQRDRLAEDLNKMISICSCETEDIDTVNEIRYFVDTITKHSNP